MRPASPRTGAVTPGVRQGFVGCLLACLTSQQHASVSQGRNCTDNCHSCHTEIEAADQTFYLTQSQYTDTGPTSPSTDPITPGAWQGSHWSANFEVTSMTRPRKFPTAQAGIEPRIFRSRCRCLTHLAKEAAPGTVATIFSRWCNSTRDKAGSDPTASCWTTPPLTIHVDTH